MAIYVLLEQKSISFRQVALPEILVCDVSCNAADNEHLQH